MEWSVSANTTDLMKRGEQPGKGLRVFPVDEQQGQQAVLLYAPPDYSE